MNTINTIRYMGNKSKLLDFIIPEIKKICPKGSSICDLMAGTNSVAYALKEDYRVITNDVEEYSTVISNAIVCNNNNQNSLIYLEDIKKFYSLNMSKMQYRYFWDNYTDKYFSGYQCKEIDSIRFAIEKVGDYKDVYLTSLMHAMNIVQSTPGHFAQFLNKDHPRVQKLRSYSVLEVFIAKLTEIAGISGSKFKNQAFNLEYRKLLDNKEIVDKIDCFYIDTPYTGEQYSRFYHVLNTVVKYDDPVVKYKAGYREDRFKSNFSLRSMALNEFKDMIGILSKLDKKIVLSYSNKGLLKESEIYDIFKENNILVKVIHKSYTHSTQGKGSNEVKELLFVTIG